MYRLPQQLAVKAASLGDRQAIETVLNSLKNHMSDDACCAEKPWIAQALETSAAKSSMANMPEAFREQAKTLSAYYQRLQLALV